MGAVAVGMSVLLVGALVLWLAWLGSQRRLPRRGDAARQEALQAAAGPLGVGGATACACGVGVLFTGLDVIGWILVIAALVSLASGIGLAAVSAVRAGRHT